MLPAGEAVFADLVHACCIYYGIVGASAFGLVPTTRGCAVHVTPRLLCSASARLVCPVFFFRPNSRGREFLGPLARR
ncbi:hypothetical protein RHOER0001_1663 [Rhodococcus erythropolis SK121]|nr:hypothetical protein RHOER0001_1663 [Rhodococcus erythropolis SK121]